MPKAKQNPECRVSRIGEGAIETSEKVRWVLKDSDILSLFSRSVILSINHHFPLPVMFFNTVISPFNPNKVRKTGYCKAFNRPVCPNVNREWFWGVGNIVVRSLRVDFGSWGAVIFWR